MLDQIERLWGRLSHTVGRGIINLVDDSGPIQTTQLQIHGGSGQPGPSMIRDGVSTLHTFGVSSVPPIGSEAAMLSMAGDPSNTVVVATGHRESRPRNMKPGQSQFYDQSGSSFLFTNDHNAKIVATGTIAINGGTLTVIGTGSITLAVGGNNVIIDSAGIHVHGTLTVDGGPIINNGVTVAVP